MATLREEGQKIAEQLGHGVVYKGPWLPYGSKGEFYGHFFEDDAVTGSSFVASTLEEAKEALIKTRKVFGAELPVFDNPLTPEVIRIDWERKIPQEVRDYWDANLENNPLRLAEKETDAGAFVAKKIENAGDVLRESAKSPSDMAYISGKLNAIRREVNSPDWGARLSSKELVALKETQSLIDKIPVPTELSQAIKDLIDAVASRTPSRITMTLDIVERKLKVIPKAEVTPPAVGGNPGRVRFDRASIDSAIAAARQLQSEKDLYIFATYLGFTIESRPPPGMQQYVVVHPDGSTETIKPFESNPTGGNPMKKRISEEEAIGMLERLSMTPDEARRSLFGSEEERRTIMTTVQERVKREQHKFAPFDPREGPPLPRIFAGLRWPWRKS